jgi:tetratricopeptide (TPR) repeat protein
MDLRPRFAPVEADVSRAADVDLVPFFGRRADFLVACGVHMVGNSVPKQGWHTYTRSGATGLPATPDTACRTISLGWLFVLLAVPGVFSGCSGFARRWQRDDVVSARQIAQQGISAFHAGDWRRAEEYFAKAVEVCPVDERVRGRYAETLWNLGKRREAIEHMREAVRLSGGEPELAVRLGEMCLAEGDLQQADQLAATVIRTGRELASAHRLRGDVLQRQGRWRDALAAYHRALSIQPQYPEVQLAVAQVYYRNGRPQRSLSTLRALANAYPPGEQPAELNYWQGLACAALGRDELAAEQLMLAQSRGMQSAELLYHLAEVRLRIGESAAAADTLAQAMEIDPQHPLAARLSDLISRDRQLASLPR